MVFENIFHHFNRKQITRHLLYRAGAIPKPMNIQHTERCCICLLLNSSNTNIKNRHNYVRQHTALPRDGILNKFEQRSSVSYQDPIEK